MSGEDTYTIKEFLSHSLEDMKQTIESIHENLKEIKADGKEVNEKIGIQNGRVRKIEDWANETKIILDSNTKNINIIGSNYDKDKARIWTAISILTVLGGVIITLSIIAIDSKIKAGIQQALLESVEDVKVAD